MSCIVGVTSLLNRASFAGSAIVMCLLFSFALWSIDILLKVVDLFWQHRLFLFKCLNFPGLDLGFKVHETEFGKATTEFAIDAEYLRIQLPIIWLGEFCFRLVVTGIFVVADASDMLFPQTKQHCGTVTFAVKNQGRPIL